MRKAADSEWYSGTANAIYQNMKYIDSYNPEYVLILSGDHIYKMDYEVMLDFHKQNNADVTIAVMPVPMEEASRFRYRRSQMRKIEFGSSRRNRQNPKKQSGIHGYLYFQLESIKGSTDCK